MAQSSAGNREHDSANTAIHNPYFLDGRPGSAWCQCPARLVFHTPTPDARPGCQMSIVLLWDVQCICLQHQM